MKSKDSIQGAYLLLKRYKNRLKAFDHTLLAMNENKVEKTEFNALKMSVDKEQAKNIYRDMQQLFDVTVNDLKARIEHDRNMFKKILH